MLEQAVFHALKSIQIILPFIHDILFMTRHNERLAEYLDLALYMGGPYCSIACKDYDVDFRKDAFGWKDWTVKRFQNCGKRVKNDTYEISKIKWLKHLRCCNQRSCPLCQKSVQLSKLLNYGRKIEKIAENNDLYLLTLTQPRCSSEELAQKVDLLQTSVRRLIKYLIGENGRPRDEFKEYGIVGALRSFEITFKLAFRKKGQEYHPHYHVILAMKKDLELRTLEKRHVHKRFSYDKDKSTGKEQFSAHFSDFEILLQSLWFVIVNDLPYNKKSMSNVDFKDKKGHTVGYLSGSSYTGGYSVKLDKVAPDDYYEVFKYCTKVYDEGSDLITAEQFVTLYHVLFKRRVFQGYGIFFNFTDDGINDSDHEIKLILETALKQIEDPVETDDCLLAMRKDMLLTKKYRYVSSKNIHILWERGELSDLENLISPELKAKLFEVKGKRFSNSVMRALDLFEKIWIKRYCRKPTDMEESLFMDTFEYNDKGHLTGFNLGKKLTEVIRDKTLPLVVSNSNYVYEDLPF